MTPQSLERLRQLADKHAEQAVQIRRRIHRFPEPGFEEVRTSALVADELQALGLTPHPIAHTGIVADLDTNRPGGYIALRADMDALAITEATGLDCASENPGYSHCCGHDGHTAALLGTARVLTGLSDDLTGRIRFIFQPAEEICGGALAVIQDGLFQPQKPHAIITLHSWSDLATNQVACMPGVMMASCDVLRILIRGKGGHGARPHNARNPLTGMARIVDAFSRMNNDKRIVSLCTADVGTQANVIADTGTLSGTIRTLDERVREQTLGHVASLAKQICTPLGLEADVTFDASSPVVTVDPRLFTIFIDLASQLLGEENVIALIEPSMGSEDFGYYLEHVPGLLFRLGMGLDSPNLHQADFSFNDDAMPTAILVLSALAVKLTSEGLPQ
jgi:amidohydrolase